VHLHASILKIPVWTGFPTATHKCIALGTMMEIQLKVMENSTHRQALNLISLAYFRQRASQQFHLNFAQKPTRFQHCHNFPFSPLSLTYALSYTQITLILCIKADEFVILEIRPKVSVSKVLRSHIG